MDLPHYFTQFLSNIRPTPAQRENLKTGHRVLRERLASFDGLSEHIVTTFLQGSYRRFTAVKPKGDERADVDVIVVTSLDEGVYSPASAMALFTPFLEKYYPKKYRTQGRSIGITLSYVDLDVVVTSAPSTVEGRDFLTSLDSGDDLICLGEDAEEIPAFSWLFGERQARSDWKSSALRIPDRDARCWEDTDPLEQIRWTQEKNRRTGGHYVNVVKAIKWWRRLTPGPKYPKSYQVEHLVGDACGERIATVAEGVVSSFDNILATHAQAISAGATPFVPDRGVATHNVLSRVSPEDFAAFYAKVEEAARVARGALDSASVKESAESWRRLFGSEFPEPPSRGEEGDRGMGPVVGGYTPRKERTELPPAGERWGQ